MVIHFTLTSLQILIEYSIKLSSASKLIRCMEHLSEARNCVHQIDRTPDSFFASALPLRNALAKLNTALSEPLGKL